MADDKDRPDDHLPASDADKVKDAERRAGAGGGTPPADPYSEAGRVLSRPPEKSRGERKTERIERERPGTSSDEEE